MSTRQANGREEGLKQEDRSHGGDTSLPLLLAMMLGFSRDSSRARTAHTLLKKPLICILTVIEAEESPES